MEQVNGVCDLWRLSDISAGDISELEALEGC